MIQTGRHGKRLFLKRILGLIWGYLTKARHQEPASLVNLAIIVDNSGVDDHTASDTKGISYFANPQISSDIDYQPRNAVNKYYNSGI